MVNKRGFDGGDFGESRALLFALGISQKKGPSRCVKWKTLLFVNHGSGVGVLGGDVRWLCGCSVYSWFESVFFAYVTDAWCFGESKYGSQEDAFVLG